MSIFFRVLSAAYIAGIFLLADSSMVADVATFNPYSLLHIPLYGFLTLLLILSFSPQSKSFVDSTNPTNSSNSSNPTNSTNPMNPMNPMNSSNATNSTHPSNSTNPTNSTNLSREMPSLFHWDPSNPSNPSSSRNYFFAGIIALVVAIADEIHQAYLPNRNASVIDVLLDIIGIILCIALISRVASKSRFINVIMFN